MKFDSMRAWQEAVAMIRANREVVAVLAGVFFFLPLFAVGLMITPLPVPPAGAQPEAILKLITGWLGENKWWLLGVTLAYDLGALAILSLLRGASRPTVGEAIGYGLGGVVPQIAARLLVVMALAALFLAMAALTGLIGLVAAANVLALIFFGFSIYVMIRTCLVSPLIGAEGLRSPLHVLRRSWALTKGNAGGIGLFFALFWIAYQVVSFLAAKLVDVAVLAMAGADASRFAGAAFGAALSALFGVYITAMLGATHRQLARPESAAGAMPHG